MMFMRQISTTCINKVSKKNGKKTNPPAYAPGEKGSGSEVADSGGSGSRHAPGATPSISSATAWPSACIAQPAQPQLRALHVRLRCQRNIVRHALAL